MTKANQSRSWRLPTNVHFPCEAHQRWPHGPRRFSGRTLVQPGGRVKDRRYRGKLNCRAFGILVVRWGMPYRTAAEGRNGRPYGSVSINPHRYIRTSLRRVGMRLAPELLGVGEATDFPTSG